MTQEKQEPGPCRIEDGFCDTHRSREWVQAMPYCEEVAINGKPRRTPLSKSDDEVRDTELLNALLFEERLDLRQRREDGLWTAGDLKSGKVLAIERDPRQAIAVFVKALRTRAQEGT